MITQDMVDQLRGIEGREYPVLSLYLGLEPGAGQLRSLSARLKDLLQPARDLAGTLPRPAAMSLRNDVKAVLEMESRIGAELGSGVAVFASHGNDLLQYMTVPIRVRDRLVVDAVPYVRPLDAVIEESQRFCAVVLDRRKADILRFYMGELEASEQMSEEALRKSNYGGFSGYDERRVRGHSEEVANRHYRDVAARLFELRKAGGYDLLVIGGQQENVEGVLAALHPDVAAVVAGTFAVDTHTVTPAIAMEHCRPVAAAHDAADKQRLVDSVIDAAKGGGLGALGMTDVLAAANLKAIETLAVETRFSTGGLRCAACGWLTESGVDACPSCRGTTVAGVPDLVDAVAIAVRASGGTVRHVLSETPLAPYQVGALTRFALTASG